MIHFGTAGWLYKDWEGIVYPAPRPAKFDPLEYLAGYFTTVEINSTYYGPASAKTAANWIARVSDYPDFEFTAKLWKRFTHDRKSALTRAEVKEPRSAFDHLMKADKLGAVLIQFPWSFRRTDQARALPVLWDISAFTAGTITTGFGKVQGSKRATIISTVVKS